MMMTLHHSIKLPDCTAGYTRPRNIKREVAVRQSMFWKKKQSKTPVAIVGTGYLEYELYKQLTSEGEFEVKYFVNEEPWSHRTYLGTAELRYPSELGALCKKGKVEAVFYCDADLLAALPELSVPITKMTE